MGFLGFIQFLTGLIDRKIGVGTISGMPDYSPTKLQHLADLQSDITRYGNNSIQLKIAHFALLTVCSSILATFEETVILGAATLMFAGLGLWFMDAQYLRYERITIALKRDVEDDKEQRLSSRNFRTYQAGRYKLWRVLFSYSVTVVHLPCFALIGLICLRNVAL